MGQYLQFILLVGLCYGIAETSSPEKWEKKSLPNSYPYYWWHQPYKPYKPPRTTTLEKKVKQLAKQIQMLQFYVEESARADGHSGVKIVRLRGEGTRPYHGASHSDDFTIGAIHDHSDFVNTCGMGEIVVVLNGIESKTRHNDYLLVKKSMKSKKFGETEDIPYPPVPPKVLYKSTVKKQILELREYFRAWKAQNITIRDYRPYFKANLCYLEGAYTISDPDKIQEAFSSERHFYEAFSWNDLYQKTRFSSYTGTKENLENYAFMPTTLWEVKDNGECVFGQWNYRILCHPLPDHLPLNRLRPVDDLKTRMSSLMTLEEYEQTRNARFQVNPFDKDEWFDGPTKHGFFDSLMEQIPGMDNYGAVLNGDSLGNSIKSFTAKPGDSTSLNAAQYHRWFQNNDNGAMGVKIRHRALNDEHMWAAMNTQENILPIRVDVCEYVDKERVCKSWEQKWSYAIPLEIVYTTPLNSWNPYNIEYKGLEKTETGQTVFRGPYNTERDGSSDPDKAFNGTNSAKFYWTPFEFYEGLEIGDDPADTPDEFVHVLDKHGNVRKVRSSGIRIVSPIIPGIGSMRQRYPIHTIYGEGSPVWKELSALSDIVLNPDKFGFMITGEGGDVVRSLKLVLVPGTATHKHDLIINPAFLADLKAGKNVTLRTELANSHSHELIIQYDSKKKQYKYIKCGTLAKCIDGHPEYLAFSSPN